MHCDDIDQDWEVEKATLDRAITTFAKQADRLGVYMPSLATYLRLHADELAEKYPDDANGGMPSPENHT